MSQKLTYGILIVGFSLLSVRTPAQEVKDTLRVLFVGNSYTYFENLPQVVSVLSGKTGTVLLTRKVTAGGAKLSEHWRGARGLNTREEINNGKYDIVVLQEWSLGTVNEKDSAEYYLGLFSGLIRNNGAKPYYYLTWAREKSPEQQETISRVYRETAAANGAKVVPVGEAWAAARAERPDFRLYFPDGSHPAELGTYLAACVFVAVLTGELPESIPGVISVRDSHGEDLILMMVGQPDVEFCRRVALESVQTR
ncbi:SGNH/GDSL hydrolase family protein [bacterium]|nr:SGNH/GDSL hydrolase family protein [bacterium]